MCFRSADSRSAVWSVKLAEIEKLVAEQKLPREVLQALHHIATRQKGLGLSDQELRQRLDQLKELHILPEQRARVSLEDSESDEVIGLILRKCDALEWPRIDVSKGPRYPDTR
jgi:hypothetical protein